MLDRRIHQGNNPETNKNLQKQREMLMERGAVTTWPISLESVKRVIKIITPKYKSFKGFRYFRLRQVGKNSSNSFNLAISGFEVYGSAYGVWDFSKQ